MPEINNAVALQTQPPPQTDPWKMLSTISNYQLGQAHLGLYNLQAAQQARQLSGYQFLQGHPGDFEGAISAGLDPAVAKTDQEVRHNSFLSSQGGGYYPSERSALSEIPLHGAQTQEAQAKTRETNVDTDYRLNQQSMFGGLRATDFEAGQRGLDYAQSIKARQLTMDSQIFSAAIGASNRDARGAIIDKFAENGHPIPQAQRDQFLSMPQQQWDEIAQRGVYAGLSAKENPAVIGAQNAARVHSTQYGEIGVNPPPLINANQQPSPAAQVQGAPSGQTINPNLPLTTPPQAANAAQQEPNPPTYDFSQPGAAKQFALDLEAKSKIATAGLEQDQKSYRAASSLIERIPIMRQNIQQLGPAWMSTGAEQKVGFAKAWNSMLDTLGGMSGNKPSPNAYFDVNKIGASESLEKEAIRAGIEYMNSQVGGAREAFGTIERFGKAVAGPGNTPVGANTLLDGMQMQAQRQKDLYEFELSYKGPLVQAQAAFNQAHPPMEYAYRTAAMTLERMNGNRGINPIQSLLADPSPARQAEFDKWSAMPGLSGFLIKSHNAQ